MGDWAFDRGQFTMTLTPKAGPADVTEHGKYLVLLQKQADGMEAGARNREPNMMMPGPAPPLQQRKRTGSSHGKYGTDTRAPDV